MERTFLGLLAGSVLGLSAVGGLGMIWAKGENPPLADGWRLLEPVSYENLTLFPVVSNHQGDTSAFLTLDEGLSSGQVVISEQGASTLRRSRSSRPTEDYDANASVNRLVLINHSKRPLILLAGELVSGGKQDRIIAKDRIIAPGAEPLPLDVFCVEHGRWSAGVEFAVAKIIVHPSVREKAAVEQRQTEVWAAVRAGSTAATPAAAPRPRIAAEDISDAIAMAAPTESYARLYDSRTVGVPIESFVEEVQKRFARATSVLKGERVIGVVVAYGGEVAWSDVFASGDLFGHYWAKLLRSYAVEALARPQLKERASAEDAHEFLRALSGRERVESEPGVYRWREVTSGSLAEIELEALHPQPMRLHWLMIHRTS
jgi:hypothetical protein